MLRRCLQVDRSWSNMSMNLHKLKSESSTGLHNSGSNPILPSSADLNDLGGNHGLQISLDMDSLLENPVEESENDWVDADEDPQTVPALRPPPNFVHFPLLHTS